MTRSFHANITNIPCRANVSNRDSIQMATINRDEYMNLWLNGAVAGDRPRHLCMHVDAAKALRDALLEAYPLGTKDSLGSGKKNFIVAVLDRKGNPEPAEHPRVCTSDKQARLVARVMAEKNPGLKFAVYEKMGEAMQPKAEFVYTPTY